MKYKVGDKVKVISKLTKNRNNYEGYFNEEMDMYLGETMTITDIRGSSYKCKGSYNFKEDNKKWFWSDEMVEGLAPFTKTDLKDNHIVVLKNGEKLLWGNITSWHEGYTDNLIHKDLYRATIKEVYEFDKLVWQRELLDEVEKKWLGDFIRPFRDRVRNIVKIDGVVGIYISIRIKGEASIDLPYLKNKNMYKGMEINKEYSLKELGLED